MSTIRAAVESLILLVKQQMHPEAVLVLPDDTFEIQRTPSVVLQGPRITENALRRSMARGVATDEANLSFEERRSPRLYHLDFDLIITVSGEVELLDFQEKCSRFLQLNTILAVPDLGVLNLTELAPLGGLTRVNLSNLRQSAGKVRIEDCPVYDGISAQGRLIVKRTIGFWETFETN